MVNAASVAAAAAVAVETKIATAIAKVTTVLPVMRLLARTAASAPAEKTTAPASQPRKALLHAIPRRVKPHVRSRESRNGLTMLSPSPPHLVPCTGTSAES